MSESIEHYLSPLFEPRSIAVFGASLKPNAAGTVVFRNLKANGFRGAIYPINLKYHTVEQQTCYRNIGDIAEPVDLAVITTPAHTLPKIFAECGAKGVKVAVVLSAGFAETGEKGRKLQAAMLENARRYGIRFVGPNSLGIVHTSSGLNATFAGGEVAPGNLALVSQSGAVCTAIMDWAANRDIGFSSIVSTGSSADLDFGEILDFLVSDGRTRNILLYVEGIQDARSFLSGLRAAARVKPVIVVKAGRHKAAIKATQSHNSARVGDDDVFNEALNRAGVVRGMHLGDLLAAANILSRGIRLKGDRLAIVTNGGGPGAMACDRATDLNIPLAELDQQTLDTLNTHLPSLWSGLNPVDILGDADPVRYELAMQTLLEDKGNDGVLVMLTPQATTDTEGIAHRLIDLRKRYKKPMLACWMGGKQVTDARKQLTQAGVPSFRLPENAVQAFAFLASFYRNQKLLLQTPGPLSQAIKPDIEGAQRIISDALERKHFSLSETESKAILAAFGIDVAATVLVSSKSEAIAAAEKMAYPLALKIHGSNLGKARIANGVQLNINNQEALCAAFESLENTLANLQQKSEDACIAIEPMISSPSARKLRLGIFQDEVFGPSISFSSGGPAAALLSERSVSLPPLNRTLAQHLIQSSPVYSVLGEFEMQPAIDMEALENCLLGVSEIACELPEIFELVINPLIADEQGVVAADARIIIRPKPEGASYSHTAIHPYPAHAEKHISLKTGINCQIRPIRPEDAEIELAFVNNLSANSKQMRFMNSFQKLPPEMLAKLTQIDYDREMAFIAVIDEQGREVEIGVARYAINIDNHSCEFAITVADDWQGKGVAMQLMDALMNYARQRGLAEMTGIVLADNRPMQNLAKRLGFDIFPSREDRSIVNLSKHL